MAEETPSTIHVLPSISYSTSTHQFVAFNYTPVPSSHPRFSCIRSRRKNKKSTTICTSCSRFGAFALCQTDGGKELYAYHEEASTSPSLLLPHIIISQGRLVRALVHIELLNINFLVRNGTCAILLHIHGKCFLVHRENRMANTAHKFCRPWKYYGTSKEESVRTPSEHVYSVYTFCAVVVHQMVVEQWTNTRIVGIGAPCQKSCSATASAAAAAVAAGSLERCVDISYLSFLCTTRFWYAFSTVYWICVPVCARCINWHPI